MEQLLHLWRQFSQPTKNKFQNTYVRTRSPHQQRGSVSIFAVVWIAITVVCCSLIVRATWVVQQRAYLQEAADTIALAALKTPNALSSLAERFHVSILSVERSGNDVSVEVGSSFGSAVSTATSAVD